MGLKGIGGGGGGTLLSAPSLAQKLEDEGTNVENANILNLFLDNVTLPAGAPAPITKNVGSIDVTSASIVFNDNFSRERYGRAAVQDPVTLDADRRSLLLDNNQTDEQKAVSLVAALEFGNGLAAVQNMSDADVTATTAPANIDQFERRPESMYLNAANINGNKRNHLMPIFRGQAEPEFIDAMVSQAGGEPTNFVTFADVVADQTIMQSISTDVIASRMLASHPNGIIPLPASETAMDEVSVAQPALEALAASPDAVSALFNSPFVITSLWESTPGAKIILQNGANNRTLPASTSTSRGNLEFKVDDGTASSLPGNTKHQLHFDNNGNTGGEFHTVGFDIDLSNASTLEVKEKHEGVDSSDLRHGMRVGGQRIIENSGTNPYTTRSASVSSFSGVTNVEFFIDNLGRNNGGDRDDYFFADLRVF